MTAPDNALAGEVVQADRDAAADLIEWQRAPYIASGRLKVPDEIRAGIRDRSGTIQAFARHRIQATLQADERVKELEGALAAAECSLRSCHTLYEVPGTLAAADTARAILAKDAPK